MLTIIQAAGWPIWPLILCSIVGLALVIERFVALKTSRIAPPTLLEEAIAVSQTRVPVADVVDQLAHNSALGEILAEGFRELTRNPRTSDANLRAAMEGKGRAAAFRIAAQREHVGVAVDDPRRRREQGGIAFQCGLEFARGADAAGSEV